MDIQLIQSKLNEYMLPLKSITLTDV